MIVVVEEEEEEGRTQTDKKAATEGDPNPTPRKTTAKSFCSVQILLTRSIRTLT